MYVEISDSKFDDENRGNIKIPFLLYQVHTQNNSQETFDSCHSFATPLRYIELLVIPEVL